MNNIFRKLFWFTDKQRRTALQKLEILGYNDPKNLTKRELIIASNLVDPKKITVSYKSIGGLSDVIDDIKKNVLIPAYKKKYKKELLPNLTKRILLHGPSGCGKTMISEAIAAEEKGIYCLKLDGTLSLFSGHLDSKCRKYKKNTKLIDALFSLARKLQPFIIFIDGFEKLNWSLNKEYKPIVADYFVDKLLHTENDLIIIGETNRFLYRKHLLFDKIIQKFYHISLPSTSTQTIYNVIQSEANTMEMAVPDQRPTTTVQPVTTTVPQTSTNDNRTSEPSPPTTPTKATSETATEAALLNATQRRNQWPLQEWKTIWRAAYKTISQQLRLEKPAPPTTPPGPGAQLQEETTPSVAETTVSEVEIPTGAA